MSSSFIRLVASQCHNCMRCVRACPTDAMTYIRNEPTIQEDICILCGRCFVACPHEAKSVRSDLKIIRKWIADGEEVIISAAPSFAAVWPKFSSLRKLLIARGFSMVDETAKGAALVSRSFLNLIEENTMDNIITTCCPAVNTLIEKEYPDLVQYMAPVVSPLIAHGRLLKQEHPGAKVVFLSPCIAKYKEITDARFAGAVDACISMEEVVTWIENDLKEDEEDDWKDFEGSIARIYPTAGGIIETLPHSDNYTYYAVDGVHRIYTALESIRKGELKKAFLEVNACRGACMGGPLLAHFTHNEWAGQARIRRNINSAKKVTSGELPVDMKAEWRADPVYRPKHTEEEIQEQMRKLGKTSPMKIHDCGACGYETCRKKAIAVLEGKADPRICLPEALEHALSLSDVVLDNTPNGIMILNEDLTVYEMNPAARKMLGLDMVNPTGLPVEGILPNEELWNVIRGTRMKTQYFHCYYENYERLLQHAIVKIPSQNRYVIILMDRTSETRKEEELNQIRMHTLDVTQQVIDEQMRAVQEIASLLGETTARSKVALRNLQEVMERDNK